MSPSLYISIPIGLAGLGVGIYFLIKILNKPKNQTPPVVNVDPATTLTITAGIPE